MRTLGKLTQCKRQACMILVAGTLLMVAIGGCAAQSRSSRTVTTTEAYPENGDMAQEEPGVVETRKTTVTQSSSAASGSSDGGIFGGAFHFIGEVLAFPFRVIASVFDAIF